MLSACAGEAVSFGEIAAWAGLTGRRPARWEIALIARIDALRRSLR